MTTMTRECIGRNLGHRCIHDIARSGDVVGLQGMSARSAAQPRDSNSSAISREACAFHLTVSMSRGTLAELFETPREAPISRRVPREQYDVDPCWPFGGSSHCFSPSLQL